MLRAKLFGIPQFDLHEQLLGSLLTGRRMALFAYLITQPEPCSRSLLADLLWVDESEQQVRENLRNLLYHLRQVVGDYLVVTRQTVTINRQLPYWVDVEIFNSYLSANQKPADVALHTEVLALYQGEFLDGIYVQNAPLYDDWLAAQRERWHTQAIQGWRHLVEYYLAQAQFENGLMANQRLLTLAPWQEEAHRQQMLLLFHTGQRTAALAQYERCCQLLRKELDAPPSAATVVLYEQIKAGQEMQAPAVTVHQVGAPNQPPNGKPQRVEPALAAPAMTPNATSDAPAPVLPVDWGAMPRDPHFYGRHPELNALQQWLVSEHCRIVAILGAGGQGKTALAAHFIETLIESKAPAFERVVWRSMLTAPLLTDILQEWLQQLSDQQVVVLPRTLDQQFTLLYEYLQRRRFLLVLDNVESLLLDDGSGACRPGYEGYEQLWQIFVQREHQCCLLLTSRERPRSLSSHEEQRGALRTLLLDGLSLADGKQLLRTHRVMGAENAIAALLRSYSGNPLALKLVADTIDELFGGDVDAFLQEETPFFADIGAVLEQQFARLSPLEVELLTWLALEQEPVTSQSLWDNLVAPPAKRDFLTALRTLVRRSLVQPQDDQFNLQNVILEYTRERLVNQIGAELSSEQLTTPTPNGQAQKGNAAAGGVSYPLVMLSAFNRYALLKAQAKVYVRAGQQRLVLEPLARRLQQYWGKRGVEALCHRLLHELRTIPQAQALVVNGYAASNILHLLLHMQIAIRGYDFSHLTLRQAYLRDATLQDVSFAATELRDCLFTDVFEAATALVFHPSGEWLAIAAFDGSIRLVRWADQQVFRRLDGHAITVFGLAISPDGKLLASTSSDQQVCVWDLETYTLRYRYSETVNFVRTVSFSPDSRWLAVAGGDGTIRLYETASGQLRHTLYSPHAWVCAVAFSPDGQWLAGGGREGDISLWRMCTLTTPSVTTPDHILQGHSRAIETLVFSHDSQLLFSGSRDHLIHVWQIPVTAHAQACQTTDQVQTPWRTLRGHRHSLRRLALSPNGRYLASGGADALVHLWDVKDGALLDTLVGHEQWVWAVAFHPRLSGNTYLLVSAGNDQRVLFWEIYAQDGVVRSQLQQGMSGYSDGVRSLAFLPQQAMLVSGGFDKVVRIWDLHNRLPSTLLTAHKDWIFSVAVSADGRWIASAGYERLVYLWPFTPSTALPGTDADATSTEATSAHHSGTAPIILSGHTAIISGLAFSPDGQTLASCCQDSKICLWNVKEQRLVQTLQWQNYLAYSVAFSPDGRLLASAHFDNTVQLWDVQSFAACAQPAHAQHFQTLTGHTGLVWMVAFTPDSQTVISTSNDHAVRLWDITGQPQRVLTGHTNTVRGLAVSPLLADGRFTFATSDDDKVIHIWDGQSGELLHRLYGHRGAIHALAYSPDGAILASASERGGIRLWDVQTGAALQILRAPRPYTDMDITGVTGITGAQKAALLALGAVEKTA